MRKRARILQIAAERKRGTISDLIVWAWERWPDAFGLPGYKEQFPHAQAVRGKLQGAHGLIAAGMIRMVSLGAWEITELGEATAALGVLLASGATFELHIDLDDLDTIEEPTLEDRDDEERQDEAAQDE